MQKWIRRVLAVALVIAGLWLAWALRQRLQQPPLVETATVVRDDVSRVLAVTGRIRPQFTNTVRPTVGGRLVELAFAEGESVEQGALMARIDDGPERARLAQARAAVAEQQSAVEQRVRDARRSEELWRGGLIPQSDHEDAETELQRARDRLAELEQSVAEIRARLRDFELRAPIDGWVLRRPVDPGQTVAADTVIYELSTRSEPMVEIAVDELYLTEIREGLSAVIAPLRDAGERWTGRVDYVGRKVDPSTGAGIVRLVFDPEDRDRAAELPVGLSLDVNIEVARHDEVLVVPREAVAGLGGAPFVFVVREVGGGEESRARRVEVEVVDWPAPRLVVRSGREEGDRVVLDPRSVAEDAPVRTRSGDSEGGANRSPDRGTD